MWITNPFGAISESAQACFMSTGEFGFKMIKIEAMSNVVVLVFAGIMMQLDVRAAVGELSVVSFLKKFPFILGYVVEESIRLIVSELK